MAESDIPGKKWIPPVAATVTAALPIFAEATTVGIEQTKPMNPNMTVITGLHIQGDIGKRFIERGNPDPDTWEESVQQAVADVTLHHGRVVLGIDSLFSLDPYSIAASNTQGLGYNYSDDERILIRASLPLRPNKLADNGSTIVVAGDIVTSAFSNPFAEFAKQNKIGNPDATSPQYQPLDDYQTTAEKKGINAATASIAVETAQVMGLAGIVYLASEHVMHPSVRFTRRQLAIRAASVAIASLGLGFLRAAAPNAQDILSDPSQKRFMQIVDAIAGEHLLVDTFDTMRTTLLYAKTEFVLGRQGSGEKVGVVVLGSGHDTKVSEIEHNPQARHDAIYKGAVDLVKLTKQMCQKFGFNAKQTNQMIDIILTNIAAVTSIHVPDSGDNTISRAQAIDSVQTQTTEQCPEIEAIIAPLRPEKM